MGGAEPGPRAIIYPAHHYHHTYGGKGLWDSWHLSALQAPWAEAFLGYGWGVKGFGLLHGGDRPPRGGRQVAAEAPWGQSPTGFCLPCC